MTFTIKNGVLTIGSKRIILTHVIAYEATHSTLVLHFGTRQESLNMGPEAVKCAAALDVHFENPETRVMPTLSPEERAELESWRAAEVERHSAEVRKFRQWKQLAHDELRQNIELRKALGPDKTLEALHPVK